MNKAAPVLLVPLTLLKPSSFFRIASSLVAPKATDFDSLTKLREFLFHRLATKQPDPFQYLHQN